MNTDYFQGMDDDYSVATIDSTGTTVAPSGTVTTDSLGGSGLADFGNSLAQAFGNAATNIVNTAGQTLANTINSQGQQIQQTMRPVTPVQAKPNYTGLVIVAVLIGAALYFSSRES